MFNRIYFHDARNQFPFDHESVSLMITSPPYFNLVDYECASQIGFSQSYEHYLEDLCLVWKRSLPVLKKDAFVCINVCPGIQLARMNQNRFCDLPHDIVQFFIEQGFYLHAEIIWDLYDSSYLKMEVEPFVEAYPRHGSVLLHNYELVLVLRLEKSFQSLMTKDLEIANFQRCIWSIPWSYDSHPPALAPELVKRLIEIFSSKNDLVFDPFVGTGTVMKTAYQLNRQFVGTEIHKETYERSSKELAILLSEEPRTD